MPEKHARKLVDGVYQVAGARGSNVYLVTSPFMCLVDAGFPIDLPPIRKAMLELGARPRDLEMVVATHYHGDHVGTVARLKRENGLRAAIHREDAAYATGETPYERFRYRPSRFLFYYSLYPLFRYRNFEPDLLLEEGMVLPLLGGLEVLHTPGHSRGSVCLYAKGRGLLFTGDLVRNEKGVLEGPPPSFTPDPEKAAASLRRLAGLDFEILLPGHGEPITSGAGGLFRRHLEGGKLWPAGRRMEERLSRKAGPPRR
jgi:glyoxylase-like metal-dependent hydrolase (beta-lactamase superfamily II)